MNAISSVSESISNAITSLLDRIKPAPKPKLYSRQKEPKKSLALSPMNNPAFSSRLSIPSQEGAMMEASKTMSRPYMVFVYTQRVHVAGQGMYELKVTNLINPYTMKATPLQPSLVNPVYFMAQGIGRNKKAISLTAE